LEGIWVDELQTDPTIKKLIHDGKYEDDDKGHPQGDKKSSNNADSLEYPENYRTCVSLFGCFWNVVRDAMGSWRNSHRSQNDVVRKGM
jgi:hypothetical protein